MSDQNTVAVKSAKVTDPFQVVIWDKDEAHPAGEVFIQTDGESHEVALTANIRARIETGELVVGDLADLRRKVEQAASPTEVHAVGTGVPPSFENPGGPRVISHDRSTEAAIASERAAKAAEQAKVDAEVAEQAAKEEAEQAAKREEARAKEGITPVQAETPAMPVRVVNEEESGKPRAPAAPARANAADKDKKD
jgi:uncharacterized sporulation protein YeaH/YhbH (DUF444 family)